MLSKKETIKKIIEMKGDCFNGGLMCSEGCYFYVNFRELCKFFHETDKTCKEFYNYKYNRVLEMSRIDKIKKVLK